MNKLLLPWSRLGTYIPAEYAEYDDQRVMLVEKIIVTRGTVTSVYCEFPIRCQWTGVTGQAVVGNISIDDNAY